MRITAIREKPVALADPLSADPNSSRRMTASAVAIDIDAGDRGRFTGYGFSSVGRYAQSGLIAERFAPRLLASPDVTGADGGLDPVRGWAAMMANEKPGGDGDRAGAVGVLDMALWDAAAKIEGIPLWELLSERYNEDRVHERVPVYADVGRGGPEQVQRILDQGHERVKIHDGGDSIEVAQTRIEAVLPLLNDDGSRLAVDVHCRCSTSEATQALADALAPYGLAWVEEPGHPHDFELLAALADYYDGGIGSGGNLFSLSEAYNLMLYGGLRPDRDVIQVDPALAYGVVEYANIVRLAEAGDWPRAHLLPNSGHLLGFHVVAGLQLGAHEVTAEPGLAVAGLSGGVVVDRGHATLPQTPGLGFETHPQLWAVLSALD